MGDLAEALRNAGQHDEALALAEKGLEIQERRGNYHNVANAHGLCAGILMVSGRLEEADARYDLALAAARQAGDKKLEGSLLVHQGILAGERNQLECASRFYGQALQRLQEADNTQGVMQTYNWLGVVEGKAGRLAEARAWYEKSRELAVRLQNQPGLGHAAQNICIICQLEGQAARERDDEPAARRHFEEARRSVEESLKVKQGLGNKAFEASSWGQLARIHLRLGDLDAAEHHAHEARRIRESLSLKEAWRDYNTLCEIAQARDDTDAAAEWARKCDDLLAELKRHAGGGGGLPE